MKAGPTKEALAASKESVRINEDIVEEIAELESARNVEKV